MKLRLLLTLLFAPCFIFSQSYDYYYDGDTSDITSSTSFGICLTGGSLNIESAQWFLNKADGGNVLVLSTSGSDGYHNLFYSTLGVSIQSVETIVMNNSTAATDPFVLTRIENAEAIWLPEGNPYLYELYFKNSSIKSLLNNHINNKGAPIGGTGAGMSILGEFYFNSQNGSITSNEALNNPYDVSLTIESNFISAPFLENTITDTHYGYPNPDKRGRHVAFIARIQEESVNNDYFGIAADEFVAICIDSNGVATVYGEYPEFDDNVYFIRTNCERSQPSVLQSNTALTWSGDDPAILACNIKGTTDGQNQFDLNTWLDINGGSWEGWSVEEGILLTEQIQHTGCISSINEFESENNNTFIYPNPTDESHTLHLAGFGSEEVWIEMYDIQGRKINNIYEGKMSNKHSLQVDVSSLNSGVYLYRITSNNEGKTIRFVKQ